jgi:voltage-gated potassium channel
VISPGSLLIQAWDAVVLLLSFTSAVVLPLAAVFGEPLSVLAAAVGWAATAVFAADIAIRIGANRAPAARGHRAKALGWVDVVAAVPLGPVVGAIRTHAAVAGMARLVPLLKLITSSRALNRADAGGVNPALRRLAVLVFWILLAIHGISCGWIRVSGNPQSLDPLSRYIRAFYWTVTTVATIGYGDITPTGNAQTHYVIGVEVIGAGLYAMVIANVASLVANIDGARVAHRDKLDRMNAFLSYRRVPAPLHRKINEYYEYLWETRRGYDESSVLDDLPDPLRLAVALHINRRIIEKVPIFEKAGDDLIRDIILNLQPVVFTPGDIVVRAGELGFDMYFISGGSVDVVSADGRRVFVTLNEGQFFGEIALLLSTPRTATIRAREYCDLYRLDKAAFDRVIARYPDFAATIKELAGRRRAEIAESERS